MDSLRHALELVQKAQNMEQKIVDALSEGDSEAAEAHCLERQRTIESIPFADFSGDLPADLQQALQQLQVDNDRLEALVKNIQGKIGQQLTQIKQGIAGSQVYREIDEHS